MSRHWVVGASPIILLAKTRHLDLLPASADVLLIPKAVAEEIRQGPSDDPAGPGPGMARRGKRQFESPQGRCRRSSPVGPGGANPARARAARLRLEGQVGDIRPVKNVGAAAPPYHRDPTGNGQGTSAQLPDLLPDSPDEGAGLHHSHSVVASWVVADVVGDKEVAFMIDRAREVNLVLRVGALN